MLNVANHSFHELLSKVNSSTNVLESLTELIKTKPYVREFLTELTTEEWATFDVDDIKYNEYKYHVSMCGAYMLSKSSWNICKQILLNPKVNVHSKIFQCKSILEMLDKDEAIIFVAILKKDLVSIYPNITYNIINVALFGVNL